MSTTTTDSCQYEQNTLKDYRVVDLLEKETQGAGGGGGGGLGGRGEVTLISLIASRGFSPLRWIPVTTKLRSFRPILKASVERVPPVTACFQNRSETLTLSLLAAYSPSLRWIPVTTKLQRRGKGLLGLGPSGN